MKCVCVFCVYVCVCKYFTKTTCSMWIRDKNTNICCIFGANEMFDICESYTRGSLVAREAGEI